MGASVNNRIHDPDVSFEMQDARRKLSVNNRMHERMWYDKWRKLPQNSRIRSPEVTGS